MYLFFISRTITSILCQTILRRDRFERHPLSRGEGGCRGGQLPSLDEGGTHRKRDPRDQRRQTKSSEGCTNAGRTMKVPWAGCRAKKDKREKKRKTSVLSASVSLTAMQTKNHW